MKIVFLDALTVGESDLSGIAKLGELVLYPSTSQELVAERCAGADVVITNKVLIRQPELDALPHTKLICIAATGTNNVDLNYAAQKGIVVKNVTNYSTESVAQTTFSLLLALIQKTAYYDHYVKSGSYFRDQLFTHHGEPFFEINQKKWGIIGLGNIGKRVATIAEAFGAQISYYSTSGKNHNASYLHQPLEQLLAESDIVSIHAPLNDQTRNLIAASQISLMKQTAFLINVGRGGIVNEVDLANALKTNQIAGAAFDVFESEPLHVDNPLMDIGVSGKMIFSPHIAWASIEARKSLIKQIENHIKSHFELKS